MSKETILIVLGGSCLIAVGIGSLLFVKTPFDLFWHYYTPFIAGMLLFAFGIIRGARGK
jgi:hypothetical protein